jgi:uncharacterized protein
LKIGILGDSHQHVKNVDLAMKYLMDTSLIIHTGDNLSDMKYINEKYSIRTIGVKGNCDVGMKGADEILEQIGDKRIYVNHGHYYGIKNNIYGLYLRGKELKADIIIFGHTHMPFCEREENILLINPGSVTYPRGGSKKSCMILNLDDEVTVNTILLEE